MKGYGVFLSNLRSSVGLSLEELARLVGTSKSTLSRLENDDIAQPFKGTMRKFVLSLAQVLCTSRRETERYLELAGVDRSLLTDVEEIQVGFLPRIAPGSPDEQTHLERLAYIYKDFLEQLGAKEAEVGISSSPPNLKLKIQEYTNILQEVQKRLDIFDSGEGPKEPSELQAVRIHHAEALEGKIVVGYQYGEELNSDIIKSSLYSLASLNAQWLMQLADIERFAVDDCIILTNSKNFQGWDPNEIKTTVLSTRLPIPDDLEKLKQEKLPVIEKDYFNSSHYRLVSFTPSFSDLDQLEVTLAPLGFHEYYSITPFFDEPLLTALDGSNVSIRQKYGNTALTYSSTDRGTSLIPAPVSIQCVVVTADQQIILMRRSSSVAFYPNHWSASFEETMNAPGLDRKGRPSRSDDADFFAAALRGLEEELAVSQDDVESIKVISLNVEYLTLSMDVIALIKLRLTGEEIRENWIVEAWDRDEASKFALLSAHLPAVVEKLFSRTLWHPTARMRLIQFLFHTYGVKVVASAVKAKQQS
ncbi:MAG: helix-turn-helix domain-containing protein [Ktedonobacteraceae bacterium]|nr:helix-turn-helix domain-containing protein [Ktedonobacteraceae bacterium]